MRNATPQITIASKLAPPDTVDHGVRRGDLLVRLEKYRPTHHNLILISAPPGFGKTTLVADWLADSEHDYAWLTLDPGDNELSVFANYLVSAIHKHDHRVPESVLDELSQPAQSEAVVLASLFLQDLRNSIRPVVIVLDDYHTIENRDVHNLVYHLLVGIPKNVSFVIVTRQDPPFPMSQFRLEDRITEFRMDELAFTLKEASEFFQETLDYPIDDDSVQRLHRHIEGWPAGLKLAALALRRTNAKEAPTRILSFVKSNSYVFDYLGEEVLANRAPELIEFLVHTSILRRFNPALCAAVTGRSDARDLLAGLVHEHLFISPIVGHPEWYRYHHVFSEFLATRLTDMERQTIHRKASGWLETHHMFGEAIRHAQLGADSVAVARLIRANAVRYLAAGHHGLLRKWIESVPQETRTDHPELFVYEAWSAYLAFDLERAEAILHRFGIGDIDDMSAGELDQRTRNALTVLRSWIHDSSGDDANLQPLRSVIDSDDIGDEFFRFHAMSLYGKISVREGNPVEALATLQRLRTESLESEDRFFSVYSVHLLAYCHIALGNRTNAERLCLEYIDKPFGDVAAGDRPFVSLLYAPLALCRFYAYDLETALAYATKALSSVEESRSYHRYVLDTGSMVLSRIQISLGNFRAASSVTPTVGSHQRTARRELIQSLEALHAGDRTGARRSHSVRAESISHPTIPDDTWLLSLKLVFGFGPRSRLWPAFERLSTVAGSNGDTASLIDIRLLQIASKLAEREEIQSISLLRDTLAMAEPGDYQQPFVDAGPELDTLLPKLGAPPLSFADQIIAQRATRNDTESPIGNEQPVLVDQLSRREREIVALIEKGMSNAEIADSLFISVGTVKWHVNNVFSKLDVKNRTSAVNRARDLRLIP